MKSKAVFLDRDGVINEDKGYVHKIEDFRVFPGVFEALKKLKQSDFKLVIVTNQSGIGRGYYSEQDYLELTEQIIKIFKQQDIEFDDILYCPHSPDENCDCRKPSPKLFLDAIKKFNLVPDNCWIIGDKFSDVKPAEKIGCKSILIKSSYTEKLTDNNLLTAKDLYEAVEIILSKND
ncbi:MAG: D-glycero-beta-D-manno-heptose 1,7-bisphosphate 7-phosphatase [archaeon]